MFKDFCFKLKPYISQIIIKKMKKVAVMFLLSLVLFSLVFSVGAIGSSTGLDDGADEADDGVDMVVNPASDLTPRERIIAKRNELKEVYREKDCESYETKRERIKCRLTHGDDYETPAGTIEETCRVADNTARCNALYSVLKNCYELEARQKDKCFKRAIGLRAKISDTPVQERGQKARDYVVALLYDLQEKVEAKAKNSEIDTEDAAEIVDEIVDIKEAILNGESKENIRTKMQALKIKWRNLVLNE